jgi:hypothetical protein
MQGYLFSHPCLVADTDFVRAQGAAAKGGKAA